MNKNLYNLEKEIEEIIFYNDAPEAFRMILKLKKVLQGHDLNDSLIKKYKDFLVKMQFIALYKISASEVLELFKNHLKVIFEFESYDLLKKTDDFIASYFYLLKDRDKFKEKLKYIISNSDLEISSNEIIIDKEEFSPSIKNWLNDFRNEFLEKGFNDNLNIIDYLSHNENIKKLNKKEKDRVEMFLHLYARLNLSSFTSAGIEDDFIISDENGDLFILSRGNLIKIKKTFSSQEDFIKEDSKKYKEKEQVNKKVEIKKDIINSSEKIFIPEEREENIKEERKNDQSSIEKLLESYKSFEIDLKSLDELIKNLEKYKNNPDGLFEKFDKDLQAENRDNLLSIMIFICQNKILDKFLNENKALLEEFKKYLSFKLSDDIIKNIISKSTSPETISLYLQFLLFKKIKLSPKNAGLFGMHLANIFKKIGQDKYFPIVYGDVNLERFVWREVIEENGLVKFK